MFGVGNLSRTSRLVLGIFVLLIVDVIWVASSELTEYIFKNQDYDKPYFSTYLKLSMFILYLAGFLLRRSWWYQCKRQNRNGDDGDKVENEGLLSEPVYVPVKYEEKSASGTESDDSLSTSRSVRFSDLSEVRQLPDTQAEEALLSRLSYSAYLRAEGIRLRAAAKLSVKQVAKLAFFFTIIFFFGNLSYQEALKDTEAGIVNVLSSTSGLFTLVLSSIFPSGTADRFTLSKLVAVSFSIGGVVMVSMSDRKFEADIPIGAIWALSGALLYALYLVLLRRKVDNEDKLNIPMFFGFVGLFTLILMWPGFFVVHYTKKEDFQWPDKIQWTFLIVNGLIGTVLSELLWLWGCFLTSSLVATLSLSLTIPMTMLADTVIKGVSYNWMFYVGTGPVFIAFFAVSFLTHWESWDPVYIGFRRCMQCVCRKRIIPTPRFWTKLRERTVTKEHYQLRDLDREQTESLIGISDGGLSNRGAES